MKHMALQMLKNKSRPKTSKQLLDTLTKIGIRYDTQHHLPMYTVVQSKELRGAPKPGAYTKNLFLRNKKGSMWLLTCCEDSDLDLHTVSTQLQAGRLSFGSIERLKQFLGVTPGSVSPFALINDSTLSVSFVMEKKLLQSKNIHLHPLDNTQTTTISTKDFLRFLAYIQHTPTYIEFTLDENKQIT